MPPLFKDHCLSLYKIPKPNCYPIPSCTPFRPIPIRVDLVLGKSDCDRIKRDTLLLCFLSSPSPMLCQRSSLKQYSWQTSSFLVKFPSVFK